LFEPYAGGQPQMAWVDFSTPFPNDKLLMAERLDNVRSRDGRFFQVPGSHELMVRFDFEVPGGSSGLFDGYGTAVLPDHQVRSFRGRSTLSLEARSMAFTPEAGCSTPNAKCRRSQADQLHTVRPISDRSSGR
jgi:hypothetical protein